MKTSSSSTPSPVSFPWLILERTPTARSSSSPPSSLLGLMVLTSFSVSLQSTINVATHSHFVKSRRGCFQLGPCEANRGSRVCFRHHQGESRYRRLWNCLRRLYGYFRGRRRLNLSNQLYLESSLLCKILLRIVYPGLCDSLRTARN